MLHYLYLPEIAFKAYQKNFYENGLFTKRSLRNTAMAISSSFYVKNFFMAEIVRLT